MIYYRIYRAVMRLAHRYNWHYAPPIYPGGDTMLKCDWCGFRAVIKRAAFRPVIGFEPARSEETKA